MHTGLLLFFFGGKSKSSTTPGASGAGSWAKTVGPESVAGTEGSGTSGTADPGAWVSWAWMRHWRKLIGKDHAQYLHLKLDLSQVQHLYPSSSSFSFYSSASPPTAVQEDIKKHQELPWAAPFKLHALTKSSSAGAAMDLERAHVRLHQLQCSQIVRTNIT